MGIALPDSEPGGRSKLASATFTFIGLAFFFGVGLAGGAAYKIYFGADGPQIADALRAPTPVAAAPAQQLAVDAPAMTEQAAPDPASLESAAAPALTSPTAPTVEQTTATPAVTAEAAPPAASPSAPEPAAQAASAEPQPVTMAETAPASPAAQPELQAAEPAPVAALVQQNKPAPAATAHRGAPQTAALHPRAPSQSDSAGGFRVQFGAFSQEDNARRLQAEIAATGLKVEVSHDQGASGHPLFFVRSPAYADRASALSAAQGAQSRAQHLPNAISIQYTIIGDHPAPALHAQR